MLKKIKKLKHFGIFQDFTASPDLDDFVQFNLLYGWNGSGKTTLSKLFYLLGTKIADPEFPNLEFDIVSDENTITKQNTLANFTYKVFVFNQPFVEENIDWKKQGAKSIIVISEDKIEERKSFFAIKDHLLPAKEQAYSAKDALFRASEKEREDFLTHQARSLKQSLQLIDTSDRRYLNYDKSKLRQFIADNEADLKGSRFILSPADLESLRQKVRPIQKAAIAISFPALLEDKLIEAESKINELTQMSVVTKSIERLQNYPDINAWVQAGLVLHQEHASNSCEFCGQPLPTDRIAKLESHFSEAYTDLIKRLHAAREWLGKQRLDDKVPEVGDLYDEFHPDYKHATKELTATEDALTSHMGELDAALNRKLSHPFDNSGSPLTGMDKLVTDIMDKQAVVLATIARHNQKSNNFQTEVAAHKNTLELHYVSEAILEKEYFSLLERIEQEKSARDGLIPEVAALKGQLTTLEASLSNVSKGAEDFNGQLHRFLGRTDISLQYDSAAKGYKIMRTGTARPANNLSEGEKTAIAFVYFTIKLKENGNNIEHSIVVVDDPISSFDSNHLFHSMAFLKASCEKAKQLFVLTHNFQYFKLIRDWILKKNDKDMIKSRVYVIEIDKGSVRRAIIQNAHASLLRYGSEYHFLFKKLSEFNEAPDLNVEHAYQVANYARKLLEGFFTFKHPKSRDFYQLMEVACKEAHIDDAVREKVYRFINKYSHHQFIDFHDSPVDNLLGEGENITQLIFAIMEKSDKNHFSEMQELCTH